MKYKFNSAFWFKNHGTLYDSFVIDAKPRGDTLSGKVVKGNSVYEVGYHSDGWLSGYFDPVKLPPRDKRGKFTTKRKQVEIVVRFNFTVPASAITKNLYVNIPLETVKVGDVFTQEPIEAKGNEYETMDVYEPA